MYHLFLASKAARQCVLYAEKHPEVDQEDLLQECFKAYGVEKNWDAVSLIDAILLNEDPRLIGAFMWREWEGKYNWGVIHSETHQHV